MSDSLPEVYLARHGETAWTISRQHTGRTTAEIRVERPGWYLFRDGCPGGESVEAVGARADRVVARLRKGRGRIILFGHSHLFPRPGRAAAGPAGGRRASLLARHCGTLGPQRRAHPGRTGRRPLE